MHRSRVASAGYRYVPLERPPFFLAGAIPKDPPFFPQNQFSKTPPPPLIIESVPLDPSLSQVPFCNFIRVFTATFYGSVTIAALITLNLDSFDRTFSIVVSLATSPYGRGTGARYRAPEAGALYTVFGAFSASPATNSHIHSLFSWLLFFHELPSVEDLLVDLLGRSMSSWFTL